MIVGLARWASIVVALGILYGGLTAHGQERVDATPAESAFASVYFLDLAPLVPPPLPPMAREVSLAKVRLLERPRYLVGRDISGAPPPLPVDLFMARVEVLEVIDGVNMAAGTKLDVFFGKPAGGQRMKYPHTPSEQTKPYFVQMYVGEDGVRRLTAHPLGRAAYDDWFKNWSDHERERSRPGASRP